MFRCSTRSSSIPFERRHGGEQPRHRLERRLNKNEAAEMKRQGRMLNGAIFRLMKRKLSMAFEKWQYEAAEMRYQQQMIRKGLMRLLQATMAAGFTASRSPPQCVHRLSLCCCTTPIG